MPIRRIIRDTKWWATDYSYAAIWQLRGLLSASPASYLSGQKRPIVIVPGVWESWTFMVPLVSLLHHLDGHPVHDFFALHRNTRPVGETARSLAEFLRANDLRDAVIVAHSEGGLIGKYAMTFCDDERRITSMVAICAPFSGSRYARYLLLPRLRAFSPSTPPPFCSREIGKQTPGSSLSSVSSIRTSSG